MTQVYRYLSFFLIFLISCSSETPVNNNQSNKQPPLIFQSWEENKYDSILNLLSLNYVNNITENNKSELLSFYNITEEMYNEYSIAYAKAVKDFYLSDSTIVHYLLHKFEGDDSKCFWVFTKNPFSSTIKNWEFNFSKEQAAIVLVYDYLMLDHQLHNQISTSTIMVEKILNTYDIKFMKEFISSNARLPVTEWRKIFARDYKL